MPIGMQIAAVCILAAGIAGLAIWAFLRKSSSPEKRELQRRLAVNAEGRLGDALITEVMDNTMYYSYSVRGVQYAASQDVSSLRDRLPAALERLIGRAGMKYLTRNPANSILLCEEWSGLRTLPPGGASANGDAVGHQAEDTALAEGLER
jgi:hypothetical protein